MIEIICVMWVFFFQAEDGIRDLVRSRGLGDVYKRQELNRIGLESWAVGDDDALSTSLSDLMNETGLVHDLSLIHI